MNKSILKIDFKNIAIILLIAIFFIADRYLKIIALSRSLEPPFNLIGHIFTFNFTANRYLAFSLPLNGWLINLLILLIIGLIIFLIFYLTLHNYRQKYIIFLLTFILFGAISNILDRLVCGYVIDYLELKYFTVFNLADAMITVGAGAIIVGSFKTKI